MLKKNPKRDGQSEFLNLFSDLKLMGEEGIHILKISSQKLIFLTYFLCIPFLKDISFSSQNIYKIHN